MPRPVHHRAVSKRPKKHWKPIRIRFKQKSNRVRTISLLPYFSIIDRSPPPPFFIYGHVVIRTLQASSTDGLIGGLSGVEFPFHLDRNQLQIPVGPRLGSTGVLLGN